MRIYYISNTIPEDNTVTSSGSEFSPATKKTKIDNDRE